MKLIKMFSDINGSDERFEKIINAWLLENKITHYEVLLSQAQSHGDCNLCCGRRTVLIKYSKPININEKTPNGD